MKKTMLTVLCVIALLLTALGGALHGFEEAALSPQKYDFIQARIDVYDSVGMDAEALSRVNALLADYLSGKADDLSIEEEVFGIRQQVFNEDEKLHMVDVQNLFSLAHIIKLTASIGGAVLLLAVSLSAGKEYRTVFAQGIKWEIISIGAFVVLGFGAFTLIGFDRLFVAFHHVFFTNDLWLMDPATDIMIRMFPSAFFERMTSQIGDYMLAGWFDASLITIFSVGIITAAAAKILTFLDTRRRKQLS